MSKELVALVLILLYLGAVNFDPDSVVRWPDYGTGDWIAYWSHARALWLGQGYFNIEYIQALQQANGLTYPPEVVQAPYYNLHNIPFYILLFLPFGALDFTTATYLWLALSTLLIAVASYSFAKTLGLGQWRWQAAFAGIAFMLGTVSLALGQPIILITACLMLAWQAQRRGRLVAAGFLLVSVGLKPHLAGLILLSMGWQALRQRQVALVAAFVTGTALLSGYFTVIEPQWFPQWRTIPTVGIRTSALLDVTERLLGLPSWFALMGIPIMLLLFWVGYRLAAHITPQMLAEQSLLSFMLAPFLFWPDMITLLPLFLCVWGYAVRRNRYAGLSILLVILLLPTLLPAEILGIQIPVDVATLVTRFMGHSTLRIYLVILLLGYLYSDSTKKAAVQVTLPSSPQLS